MRQEKRGQELGAKLVERIKSGEFPKNHLMNHGENFTGGSEDLLVYEFDRYMCSCGHAMMNFRLAKKGCIYLGY